jgi:hypothetical protein
VTITLTDCVARGEAVFLRTEGLQPVDLVWSNGLLITTKQLLAADGAEKPPQLSEIIRIELEHLAAIVDGGLCRLNCSELGPHQPATHVKCTNSVLVGTARAALIEEVGATNREQSLERIDWRGDRNLYQGFTEFWTIRYLNPETPPEVKDFEQWRSWWGPESEKSTSSGLLEPFRLPGPERPVHALTPDDYAWATAAGDTPVGDEAVQAQQAGFRADRLRPPPEQATEAALDTVTAPDF